MIPAPTPAPAPVQDTRLLTIHPLTVKFPVKWRLRQLVYCTTSGSAPTQRRTGNATLRTPNASDLSGTSSSGMVSLTGSLSLSHAHTHSFIISSCLCSVQTDGSLYLRKVSRSEFKEGPLSQIKTCKKHITISVKLK
jgi:hypothetical protein